MPRAVPKSPQRRVRDLSMLEGQPESTGGRPSLYKPEHCGIVLSLGKQGKSKAQMCSVLNIGRRTFMDWERQYPVFASAVARAMEHAQSWWEEKGQKSLGRKHFQAQLWRYSMAGRFKEDYAERPGAGLAEALPDFLAAITEAADRRREARAKRLPGDDAQPVDPLQVVTSDPKKDQ